MTAIPDAGCISRVSSRASTTGPETTGPASSPNTPPIATRASGVATRYPDIGEPLNVGVAFAQLAADGAVRVVDPPAQLRPPPIPFVGRDAEQRRLDGLLGNTRDPQTGTTVVHLRGERRGVGASALATHWLHHHTHTDFADGQLYADLAIPRVNPAAEILGDWLRVLGVAPQRIPRELDERTILLRQTIGNRCVALLVDNADQVDDTELLPLIPTMQRGLVLVTSSREHPHLSAHGATVVRIHPLSRHALFDLVTAIAGDGGVGAETGLFRDLDVLCAGLPGPLTVSAACLALQPQIHPAGLIGPLRQERRAARRTTAEGTATVATTARAIYDIAYRGLSSVARHAYRAVGVHPRTPIDVHAFAAATGVPRLTAHNILAELREARLISPARADAAWWIMDREIWDHAHALATGDGADTAARLAGEDVAARIAEYYLGALRQANRTIIPSRPELPTSIDQHPLLLPDLTSIHDATTWAATNWATLLQLQAQAVERQRYDLGLHYLHAMDLVRQLHGREHDLLPAIVRLLRVLSGRTTSHNLLLLSELAARNALDASHLTEALTYIAEMDTLAAQTSNAAAVARTARLRAEIYLRAGSAELAADGFRRHLRLIDEAATGLALDQFDPAPVEVWARARALDHLDLSIALTELGHPAPARAYADLAGKILRGLRQDDPLSLARAHCALVAATVAIRTTSTTACADDAATPSTSSGGGSSDRHRELVHLAGLIGHAMAVLTDLGTVGQQAHAVRLAVALARSSDVVTAARSVPADNSRTAADIAESPCRND